MSEIIVTERLTKTYKEVVAVSDISLNVRKGEIYGFLGLNGAGKTTTIRMLLGMIKPDRGVAFINGKKVHSNCVDLWNDIGYLVEVPYAYPDLTVRENLQIIQRLRLLKDLRVVDEIMDKLKLTKYASRKAKHLSLGNAQRLGLAKALIHHPRILFLDEPANGLDPAGIFEIRALLHDLSLNHGVTIFISSHILGEISKFSTRIGIIHDGSLIQEINTPQLQQLCAQKLRFSTMDNLQAKTVLEEQNIRVTVTPEGLLEIGEEEYIQHPDRIATLLVNQQVAPTELGIVEEDLESYFLRTINQRELCKI